MRAFGLLALSLLGGCRLERDAFFLQPSDAPFVSDLGVLEPIGDDEIGRVGFDYTSVPEKIRYAQLGAGENPGIYGGATFQFAGTGGPVCVVVDPESVFWNMDLSSSTTPRYKHEDVYTDDGDIDLSVGLTAYYTGSPGEEIGDFEASYTDSLGTEHRLEFNECVQYGQFGDVVHAGRATVEYCTIDTELHPGIMYTAVLETFALPIDDNVLNFGTMVYDGACNELIWFKEDVTEAQQGASECTLPNEVQFADPNLEIPEEKAWFPEIEQALCGGKNKVNTWCEENPGQGCQEEDEYE